MRGVRGEGALFPTALQRRILRFFKEHPHAVEAVRGIASWVGVEVDSIGEALKGLLEKKWLTADKTSAVIGYALTRDERLLAQIQQVLEME